MNLLTGTDPLSLEILDGLSDGMKVKDIPNSFGVSLDQAKRLSRYHRILRQAKASLNDFQYDKCKEAVNDFKNDERWQNYLDFCDEFYFLVGFPLYHYYHRKDTEQAGLLLEKGRTLEIIEKDRLEHKPNSREKVMHLVRRTLSRKYVFSY